MNDYIAKPTKVKAIPWTGDNLNAIRNLIGKPEPQLVFNGDCLQVTPKGRQTVLVFKGWYLVIINEYLMLSLNEYELNELYGREVN